MSRLAAAVAGVGRVAAALTLAGCAAMPTGGPVDEGRPAGQAEGPGEPVVQVFAEPPGGGESALQIVQGFLEASAAGESDFATARAYLAPPADKDWAPESQVSVYDHAAASLRDVPGGRVELAAPLVGTLDARGGFTPAEPGRLVQAVFGLALVQGQWRIVESPPGLYISLQDFRREYRPVALHFLTPDGAMLVPDPIHLPARRKLATPVVQALLSGPTAWLGEAVRTAVPSGATLAGRVVVRSGVAEVRLTASAGRLSDDEQRRLVAQLVWTLTQLEEIQSVQVLADGVPLRAIGRAPQARAQHRRFAPADARAERTGYFVRDGRAVTMAGRLAPGAVGDGRFIVAEIAASAHRGALAAVSGDRRLLWLGDPEHPQVRLSRPALHSPSFGRPGEVWVVSGDGVAPVVWLVPAGRPPSVVAADGLGGRTLPVLRVSDDGTRVALIASGPAGRQVLVGRVVRRGTGLAVTGLRAVGHGLLGARDVSWAGADRLVVVAEQARSQPQPYTIMVDGSEVEPGEPLAQIVAVAAAPRQPLIAGTSDGRVWRLPEGGSWIQVGRGARPVYAG